MLNLADIQPDEVRPLHRSEYDRLVESGAFEDERVELIEGILVTMSPQDATHAHTVQRLSELLFVALHGRAIVRVQSPLALSEASEPEPDLVVVPLGDYSKGHPTGALLIVEVAVSSQRRDRLVKGPIYARCAIPEYWLVDVKARVVEVYRDPGPDGYRAVTSHDATQTVQALKFPEVGFRVESVLPTAGSP